MRPTMIATNAKKKPTDPGVVALRLAMERRGWKDEDLAAAIQVKLVTVRNTFCDSFSRKAMRLRVNKCFAPQVIFTEGVGKERKQ